MKLLAAFVLASTLLMTACTSLPNTDTGKRAHLQQIMPTEQAINAHGSSMLYRNTFEISISGINRAEDMEFLELVLTDDQMQFYEWRDDAREYNLKYHYSIDEVSRLKEDDYFGAPYIAVKVGNEYIAFFIGRGEPERHKNTLRYLATKTGLAVETE